MRRRLGIYFDTDGIAVAQVDDRNLTQAGFYPYTLPGEEPAEEFVSGIKIRSLLEEILKNLSVGSADTYVGVSDIKSIFRFLEMPIMKRKELKLALPLEAERYMPFKIEDIAWDYKEKRSFREKKVKVAFTGVKDDVVNELVETFKELNMPIKSIEGASFSTVGALIHMNKISRKNKNFAVFILSETQGEISIFDDNFPYFCRHTRLPADEQGIMNIGKIVDELRITLDYYRRERGKKSLEKLFVLGKNDILEPFLTGLSELEIDVEKILIESLPEASITTVQQFKAYSLALRDLRPPVLTFNYLAQKEEAIDGVALAADVTDVRWDLRALVIPLVIGLISFFSLLFFNVKAETDKVVEEARVIKELNKFNMPSSLKSLKSLEKKIKRLDSVWDQMWSQAEIRRNAGVFLKLISDSMSDGMWLDDINFRGAAPNRKSAISVKGAIFLSSADKERESLSVFISALKSSKPVKEEGLRVVVNSIEQGKLEGYDITSFDVRVE